MLWMKINRTLLVRFGLALINILVLASIIVLHVMHVRAQTTAGLPAQTTFGGVHTACTLSPGPAVPPALPQASLCMAGDGIWLSVNGGAYVQLGAAVAGGVSSIAVCNAAGLICGAPQTGAVSLSIPKTATGTAPAQPVTVTLQ